MLHPRLKAHDPRRDDFSVRVHELKRKTGHGPLASAVPSLQQLEPEPLAMQSASCAAAYVQSNPQRVST